MNTIKTAILGSTGHIAKGLISVLCDDPQIELFLFARSMDKLISFLEDNNLSARVNCIPMCRDAIEGKYDAVINCTGIGTPAGLSYSADNMFLITEQFDNMAIKYLMENPKALYINMSSGAVYGGDFTAPAGKDTEIVLKIDDPAAKTSYAIAKLNSELKHRSLKSLNIIDLRVFSYFSRHIDLGAEYLITEMIRSIKDRSVFRTDSRNIFRDYIGPEDLCSLLKKCVFKAGNDSYDVYSKSPVAKTEVLESFKREFGLAYEVVDDLEILHPTGIKPMYYSTNRKAASIGYEPKHSSIETLISETKYILGGK